MHNIGAYRRQSPAAPRNVHERQRVGGRVHWLVRCGVDERYSLKPNVKPKQPAKEPTFLPLMDTVINLFYWVN